MKKLLEPTISKIALLVVFFISISFVQIVFFGNIGGDNKIGFPLVFHISRYCFPGTECKDVFYVFNFFIDLFILYAISSYLVTDYRKYKEKRSHSRS